jgi:hypothetical protein
MNVTRLNRSPEAILSAMGQLLLDAQQRGGSRDRRTEPRAPIRVPVELTLLPLGGEELFELPDGPKIPAQTSNISTSGIGLLHAEPLESHHVLASFSLISGQTVSVMVRLTWRCSLGELGHASGGEVVAVVRPRLNAERPASLVGRRAH